MALLTEPEYFSRARMINLLGEMSAAKAVGASTIYLPPSVAPETAASLMGDKIDAGVRQALAGIAAGSKTGAVLFSGSEPGCLILPPLPLREQAKLEGYQVAPLLKLLETDFTVAVILVRLGFYAIGLFRGESAVSGKAGTGLVHGRHKKGGSSQARFRRHREKQIEGFLGRVCAHIREHLEPEERHIDYVVYGGAHTTILSLQKRCDFLGRFEDRLLPPLLDTPEPHRNTLDASIKRVWSSRVLFWDRGDKPENPRQGAGKGFPCSFPPLTKGGQGGFPS